MKWLRNDTLLLWLLGGSIILAIMGMVNRVPEGPRLNTWDGLTGPLVYVLTYSALRWMYKRVNKREPTYAYMSRYDWEDRRKLDTLDYVVHLVPVLLGLVFPMGLTRVLG